MSRLVCQGGPLDRKVVSVPRGHRGPVELVHASHRIGEPGVEMIRALYRLAPPTPDVPLPAGVDDQQVLVPIGSRS